MVGGWDGNYLSSTELFPRPPSDTCSIPDLPQARDGHSLSLLSGGRLVVCGGYDGGSFPDGQVSTFDSCISWVAGNTSWTPLYTLRCIPMIKITFYKTKSQSAENGAQGLDASFSS